MKVSVEKKVTIWFVLALCLSLFFAYLTFRSRIDYVERGRWVLLSNNIQSEIQNINDFMQQLEINSHHYLLTGKKECINSYNLALDSLNKSINHFAELTKDNPRQQELLKVLSRINERKLLRNQASLLAGRSWQGRYDVLQQVADGYNQNLVDSLRIVIDKMDSEEDRRLDESILSQQHASEHASASLILLVALFLLMVGIFYWLILDDIKKRKKAELKLEENEAFLKMIFNEATDALFLSDSKTGLIEKCNKAAVEMFEAKGEEELLKTFGSRFQKTPIEEDDIVEIDATVKNEGVWKSEIEYKTPSGREFWGSISINEFEFNSVVYRMTRIADITEKKESERVLRSYSVALEESRNRLQSLTSELLLKNNELKKSEAALKDLNASKDKFFSILAHDMRSPFTGLLGIAEYVAECNDIIPKGELKELLEAIYASAKKVFGLLNNLLEWARLQMGKFEYLPSEVNLNGITDEIIELQLPNARTKHITLKNEIRGDVQVYADQNMISTIFRNLISNAIKFTNTGGEVILSAEKKGLSAEIKVCDTGIGMSREVQDKIFRIDSKHTTKGTAGEEGTGLGLVLCKELVEKNHGEIRAKSEPGSGSEIIFTLPLAVQIGEITEKGLN